MKTGRKFWLAIIYEGTLLLVLAGITIAGKLDGVMFGAWLAAFGGGFVTYVMGNVAVKGNGKEPTPPVPGS